MSQNFGLVQSNIFPKNRFNMGENVVHISEKTINSLPNDEFLDWTNIKTFADDKTNVARTMIGINTGHPSPIAQAVALCT